MLWRDVLGLLPISRLSTHNHKGGPRMGGSLELPERGELLDFLSKESRKEGRVLLSEGQSLGC